MTEEKEDRNLPVPAGQTKAEPRPTQSGEAPVGRQVSVRREFFSGEIFTGPLPHPESLAKYNDAFPGCSERIVKMAEDQAQHRRSLESMVVESNIKRQGVAQWLAFVAFMALCGGSFYLFSMGKDATAIAILVGNLLTFGWAYIYGQRKQDRELEEKRKPFEPPPKEPPKELPK